MPIGNLFFRIGYFLSGFKIFRAFRIRRVYVQYPSAGVSYLQRCCMKKAAFFLFFCFSVALLFSQNMVFVEGGTFQMGSTTGDNDEKPVHTVTVKSFYMGKYEVSQKEWTAVMGTTITQQRDMANKSWPLKGESDNHPIYYVNWYEAVEYCNKLSLKDGLAPAYRGSGDTVICDFNATGYRLPTEAEWEYAARGGNKGPTAYEYSGGNSVDGVAWYNGNSGGTTHPVGTKQPNSLGLYDMSGNVWEWCWDWYGSYSNGNQTDPAGASSVAYRVFRGGSWFTDAAYVRSAYRAYGTPSARNSSLGFRLVRP
jgi:formylglycine-generating enzyme required for sulfatase activity